MKTTPTFRVALASIFGGIIVVIAAWSTLPLWHTQTINMNKVDEWRAQHEGVFREFAEEHEIHLTVFTYTGGDGMVGARIDKADEDDLAATREFLMELGPPRPIHLNAFGKDGKRIAAPPLRK